MEVLRSNVDVRSETYKANREGFLEQLAVLYEQLAMLRAGGGEKYVKRHLERGKLMARERIELLLDRHSPFLELSPLAAWGTEFGLGAGIISGIGVVSGVECVITANEPTMKGGTPRKTAFTRSGSGLPSFWPWSRRSRSRESASMISCDSARNSSRMRSGSSVTSLRSSSRR